MAERKRARSKAPAKASAKGRPKAPPKRAAAAPAGAGPRTLDSRTFAKERLIEDARPLLGVPPHVAAGALYGSAPGETMTVDEALADVEAFLGHHVYSSSVPVVVDERTPPTPGQVLVSGGPGQPAAWGTDPGASVEARLGSLVGPSELGYRPIKLGIVVGPGAPGAWDEAFVEGGQVFWDPGRQRWGMVFVGYSGALSGGFPPAGSLGKVGLAWSDDLLSWTKDPGNPIFAGTGNVGVDWDGGTVTAPLMRVENGVYYLYYIAVPSAGWEASGGGQLKLGVATASSATGPFTRAAGNPLISPSGSGTFWRSNHIFHPSVTKRLDTYYLFFNASRLSDSKEQIGYAYASSPVGPWTVDDGNSPVLTGAGGSGWDSNLVVDPFVFRAPDGTWFMAYTGNAGGGGYVNSGYAWTTDAEFPLGWRRHAANPFLSSDKVWDASVCGKSCIVHHGGACFHFHTVRDVSTSPSQIGLAVKGVRGLLPKRFIGAAGQPAFGAGFGPNGSGFEEPNFWRDGDEVKIGGIAKTTGAVGTNAILFTLPLDFRPTGSRAVMTLQSSPDASVRLNFQVPGTVRTVTALASGQFLSLDGFGFRL